MSYGFDTAGRAGAHLVAITTEVRVRVLNCSAAGCLLETSRGLPVGAVAALHVTVAGREFADAVKVVRCQQIVGAAGVFHIGAEFVCVAPPYVGTLRHLMHHEEQTLSGWLAPDDGR